MGKEGYGPSWNDCAELAAYIWDRYGYRVDLRLVQAVRRADGKGNSAWQVVASISPREGRTGASATTSSPWGAGGAASTCPQALHSALATLEDILKEREASAAKQARF